MGKQLIITEEEINRIKLLYEITGDSYIKENTFLQKYVGKTYNVYKNNSFTEGAGVLKVHDIKYGDYKGKLGILINYDNDKMYQFIDCNYNPSKIGYKIEQKIYVPPISADYTQYTKSMVDDINQKGTAAGIKWCQKPKTDFGIKSVNE